MKPPRACVVLLLVAALGCGRTELSAQAECAAGDVQRCEVQGRVGFERCSPAGRWTTCVPDSATGATAGTGSTAGSGGGGGGGGGEPVCQPTVENCASPEDEDCDGNTPACSAEVELALTFRGENTQRIFGLDATESGKFAISGSTAADLDFGAPTEPLVHVGKSDGFLALFDEQGQPVWSKLIGDAEDQELRRIAFDPSNNLIAAGTFSGTYRFENQEIVANGEDALLAKFDGDGRTQWAKLFGDAEVQRGWDVATLPTGDIATVGSFYGSIDFGGGAIVAIGADSYAAKFDADGNCIWNRECTGKGTQQPWGVAMDPDGSVIVGGTFESELDCGDSANAVSSGASDVFVAKYAASGGLLFKRTFGNPGYEEVRGVAVDSAGNIVVAGSFDGDLTVGAHTVSGVHDVFVVKFDPFGEVLWARRYGGDVFDVVRHVTVDRFDNVLVSGWFQHTLDTPQPITADAADGFVLKLDPNGDFVWNRQLSGANSQDGFVLGSDGLANVYLAGSFWQEIDLAGGVVSAYDEQADLYVVKFAP